MAASSHSVKSATLRLDSSDLAERLFVGKSLTSYQRLALENPKVVQSLEKLWSMPITGDYNYFINNYPAHHFTLSYSKYHSLKQAIDLAIADGYVDVIESFRILYLDLLVKRIEIVSRQECLKTPACTRGRSSVLVALIEIWEKYPHNSPISESILNRLRFKYHFALCVSGDLNKLKTEASSLIKVSTDDFKLLRTAAIIGDHYDVLNLLDEIPQSQLIWVGSKMINKFDSFDVATAALYGNLNMVRRLINTMKTLNFIPEGQEVKWLENAIRSGNLKLVKYIMEQFELELKPEHVEPTLFSNNVEMIDFFDEKCPGELQSKFARLKAFSQSLGLPFATNVVILKHLTSKGCTFEPYQILASAWIQYDFAMTQYAIDLMTLHVFCDKGSFKPIEARQPKHMVRTGLKTKYEALCRV